MKERIVNVQDFILRFTRNADAIGALAAGVEPEQARWRPEPDKWSITEVINHLYDEEREDFRMRLDITLHKPGETWPPIDPPGWAIERKYNERDLAESLERWQSERAKSIEWLGRIEAPDWERAYEHPKIGRLTAGDLLVSWLCHDFLHIRQLGRLHYLYAEHVAAPHSPAYAGPVQA